MAAELSILNTPGSPCSQHIHTQKAQLALCILSLAALDPGLQHPMGQLHPAPGPILLAPGPSTTAEICSVGSVWSFCFLPGYFGMQQQSTAAISAGGEQAEALAMGEMEAWPERSVAWNGLVIDALSAAMLVGFHPLEVPQQRTSDAALSIHDKVQQLQKGSTEPGSLLVGH